MILAVAAWAAALSQGPAKFEVASIKPSVARPPIVLGDGRRGNGGGCPTTFKLDRSRVDMQCVTLAMLIGYAYRFSPDRVKGPDWMMTVSSPRFDIAAKLPQDVRVSQIPDMVQAMLADRFGLAIHRTSTEQGVYALLTIRGGVKLTQSTDPQPADMDDPETRSLSYGDVEEASTDGVTTMSNPRMGLVRATETPEGFSRWEAGSTSLQGLADLLDRVMPLPLPIVDLTGSKGRYRLVLEVSLKDVYAHHDPGDTEEMVVKAFNDGLRRLGLQLQRRRSAVETIVVDRVQKTPTEN